MAISPAPVEQACSILYQPGICIQVFFLDGSFEVIPFQREELAQLGQPVNGHFPLGVEWGMVQATIYWLRRITGHDFLTVEEGKRWARKT